MLLYLLKSFKFLKRLLTNLWDEINEINSYTSFGIWSLVALFWRNFMDYQSYISVCMYKYIYLMYIIISYMCIYNKYVIACYTIYNYDNVYMGYTWHIYVYFYYLPWEIALWSWP